MTEVKNLAELRTIAGSATPPAAGYETVYVKYHTTPTDRGGGIFLWRDETEFKTGMYSADNNGTIIQPNTGVPNRTGGRWVRQYDDMISVAFFGSSGIFGSGGLDTTNFQRAIDFAKLNTQPDVLLKGSTIFIPNGSYFIKNIILKNGVSIIGESFEFTNIFSDDNAGSVPDYLFKMDTWRVIINISNLNIVGNGTLKGCFNFKAVAVTVDGHKDGGLWHSTFKNIQIRGFKGHGIYLEGGDDDYESPNQFNVFENIAVNKHPDYEGYTNYSNSLRMTGQIGQHTFINCTFDGFKNPTTNAFCKWYNVEIRHNFYPTAGVVTFLNCSFQQSDYGILMQYAENVTIDNCWLEDLGVAIMLIGTGTPEPNKSINILNNRFANAAGFGSQPIAAGNVRPGRCISVENSVANIHNNYVTVSNPASPNVVGSGFVLGMPGNHGINLSGNTFRANNLNNSYGVMQTIPVTTVGGQYSIDCKSNKLVFVTQNANPITNIISSIGAGEKLTIRADAGSISFTPATPTVGNVFLSNKTSFILNAGEIAVFVKIDIGTASETYQLESVMRAGTL